ncbi:unnamed protein product [Calypogeia fissa]
MSSDTMRHDKLHTSRPGSKQSSFQSKDIMFEDRFSCAMNLSSKFILLFVLVLVRIWIQGKQVRQEAGPEKQMLANNLRRPLWSQLFSTLGKAIAPCLRNSTSYLQGSKVI